MKKQIGIAWLVLLLVSCNKEQQLFKDMKGDISGQLEIRFEEPLARMYQPDRLNDDLQFLDYAYSLLQLLDTSRLKPAQQEEWNALQLNITAKQTGLKVYRKHPEFYDMTPWIDSLLQEQNNLNNKLLQVEAVLDSAGLFFEYAQKNTDYFPSDRTAAAIEAQRNLIELLQVPLRDSLHQSTLTEAQKEEIEKKTEDCILAASDYAAYCRSKLYEKEQTE